MGTAHTNEIVLVAAVLDLEVIPIELIKNAPFFDGGRTFHDVAGGRDGVVCGAGPVHADTHRRGGYPARLVAEKPLGGENGGSD